MSEHRSAAEERSDQRHSEHRSAAEERSDQRHSEHRSAAEERSDQRHSEHRSAAEERSDQRHSEHRSAAEERSDQRHSEHRSAPPLGPNATGLLSPARARARVHARLLAEGDGAVAPERLSALVCEEAPLLGARQRAQVVDEVLAEVRGLGPLEPLLADPAVTEVMVNGPGKVWVERAGRLERVALSLDGPAIEHLIEKVVGPLGLRVDRSAPLVDARLPDGSRVNAVVPPLAVDGPCLTIRRFGARHLSLDAFASPAVAGLLAWAVAARLNVLVAGGTGAGKTTLLNALGGCIPPGDRVVTVEDAAELRLPGEHVVRLEARPPNAEGAGAVRVRDLVRNALRMRPDRILVGEVRGPEALDMLQAMNTGHEGSLSTCHANSPEDALRRLETMVLMGDVDLPLDAVRAQLESALDLVVQVARGPGGSRRVVEVAEVTESAGSPFAPRTRTLAGTTGVVALPTRPPRVTEAGDPDPAWVAAPEPHAEPM